MHKVIDYKKVDMSDDEYNYYKHLVETFSDKDKNISGSIYFKDLFDTDKDGLITLIKTEKVVPWAVLFFMQQLMLSQRIRLIDGLLDRALKIESKINVKMEKLDDKISKM